MRHLTALLCACLLAGTVSAAQQSSVSQYDITWTFDKDYEVGQYANGDYWVVGPVTITAISPDFTGKYHGWEINPDDIVNHGFDERIYNYDASLVPDLPAVVPANSSVMKAISLDSTIAMPCRPCLRTSAVLTVVDAEPADAGATVFRPPYFADGKPAISTTGLQTQHLPSYPPPPKTPALATMIAAFQRVQMDHKFDWRNREMHPVENMPAYGADLASQNAEGVLRLLLDDPLQDKMPLLINLVQAGIDYYYMWKNGLTWPGNGGFFHGRKLMITLAAVMLDDQEMKDAVRNSDDQDFDENGSFHLSRDGKALFGQHRTSQSNQETELAYWHSVSQDKGRRTIRDPYRYIDASRLPGMTGSYQLCCLSQPYKGLVLPAHIIPEIKSVMGDTLIFNYVDRWVSVGTWTQPDPCAPLPELTSEEWDVKDTHGYGTTWGPAPGNSADCHLTRTCECIRDMDSTDGIGRFPEVHGTYKDAGTYDSDFVKYMHTLYRDSTYTAAIHGDTPMMREPLPAVTNPVRYQEIIARYPDAELFDFNGTRITLPAPGMVLLRVEGYEPRAVMLID